MKQKLKNANMSQMLLIAFLIVLLASVIPLGINPGMLYADCLVRIGMNGTFVLASMISIYCGAGLNFGLPIGIIAGLLGGAIAQEHNFVGLGGFLGACVISIPFAVGFGWLYAKLLNNVKKGSEMSVGNYMAFSIVSLMSLMWLILPFKNPKVLWPLSGAGLRNTLTLEESYSAILDDYLRIDFKELGILQNSAVFKDISIPSGLLLSFILICVLIWLFTKTKYGMMMRCCGGNYRFTEYMGISTKSIRTTGIIISTVLAAIGINIYSQSYGFYQFYSAPLMMAFPAMAAILIGGATPKRASVKNAVLGVIIFQSLMTVATPVANALINAGTISEEIRKVIQNGVIIYALTKAREN